MKAEIIAVGTELLLGNIVNTNAQYLSRQLASLGYDVYYQSVIGDNFERASACIKEAAKRSDAVLITGGLGPTPDDLSKEAAASALGLTLELNEESLENIKEYYRATGRKMADSNIKQALFPTERCTIFKNLNGTAPGCAMESEDGNAVILMPGVPSEMKLMFETSVMPYLKKKSDKIIFSENVLIAGIGESYLASLIPELINGNDPTVSPYCKPGQVTLRVTSAAKTEKEAKEKCDTAVDFLKKKFGKNVCGINTAGLEYDVVGLLKEKHLHLAVAESCTAGLVSSAITNVPGASAVFDFGASTYSNEMKMKLLGVKSETLAAVGAVSAETAVEMAYGIREYAAADLGVSLTGVAGPGQSENKPAGLVYIGLSDGKNIWVEKLTVGKAQNDREKVRNSATVHALDLVRRYLLYYPDTMPRGTDTDNINTFTPEEAAVSEISDI